jgi:hypothetical protein
VFSHGYWQTHPQAWCMETIMLGCVTYTQAQAIAIMRHATSQDRTYLVAQELIAAKLNVQCKGGNPSCVSNLIAAADAWLCQHPIGSGVSGGSAAWKQIKATYAAMEKYNTGHSCAPSCDTPSQFLPAPPSNTE